MSAPADTGIDWSDRFAFWAKLRAMFNQDDDAVSFKVLRSPLSADPRRGLVVIVHPGDAAADEDDSRRGYLLTAQVLMYCEIDRLMRDGYEIAILHRGSSGYGFADDGVDLDYKRAIENAHKTGACLLYGDDLPAAADWIVRNLAAADRPDVLVTGAWADAAHGCAAMIADRLHQVGAKVRLSQEAPVTRPRRHHKDRWRPPEGQAPEPFV